MKKLLALALCAAMLLVASSALAVDVDFVTAGTSGAFYAISVTVVDLWNQNIEGIRATATPSSGGVENLNLAREGEAQIGIANANLVYQSQNGLAPFAEADEDIMIFAGLYYNPNQLVVAKDSGIDSLEALLGKHISVGPGGSTTVDEATVHLGALGATLDDIQAEYMDVNDAAEAMSNRLIDGAWVMSGVPTPAVTQIMTQNDAMIVPITADVVDQLKEEYPWYASYTIPAGTYAGQDEDVETSAVKLTLFLTSDVDEETAYQMTKVFWENWDYLTETHAALRAADPAKACEDLAGVPLHPGAARYYREIGLID